MFTPHYNITDAMVSKLSRIAEIKSFVDRSRLLPAKEVFLKRAAIIKIAHTSTSIEGNTLAEYQVAKVAGGGRVRADEGQIVEVKNYLAALRYIDILAGQKSTLQTKDILSLHRLVMKGLIRQEKIGVLRKAPVYVVNILPDKEERLVYTPPAAKHVPELLKDLTGWLALQKDVHPIIRAGLFHYQFETIHPFPDGNGRTGRLATLLHLYQSGWDFRKILVLEDYYNRDRKRYYQSLQTGDSYNIRKNADLTGWLEYFIDGFLDEVQKVKTSVLNIASLPRPAACINRLSTDELRIVDFILTIGRITSSDVSDILHIPRRTAQDKLKKLQRMGVLEKRLAGRATYYVIPKIA